MVLKESAYALGSTTWEVLWNVVLPYARGGVMGGIMLALGRALGETMAVTFVVGNANRITTSLFAPGTTISATIANEFTEAVGDLYYSSLIELVCCCSPSLSSCSLPRNTCFTSWRSAREAGRHYREHQYGAL